MAATQETLYGELDLALSWSERELPERERTRHVHRLHPYLGKFVPQLVEALLARYVRPGGRVLDPFAGSGTTLVQALESGYDAVGVDVAAFNALLMQVKTRSYDLRLLRQEMEEVHASLGQSGRRPSGYVRDWFAPGAAGELFHLRDRLLEYTHADVLRVVLARAARSARLTTHFDLDFPRTPQAGEYWCHKHRRTCRPVESAQKFISRYLLDTLARLEGFAAVRDPRRGAVVLGGDAREVELGGPYDGVITSPPYPGLIDYHEQHRYAYELLGLDDRREREVRSRGARNEPGRPRGVCGRADAGAHAAPDGGAAGGADLRDRERPPQPLSRGAAPRGSAARGAAGAAREPAYRAPRGRILRVDPDRHAFVTESLRFRDRLTRSVEACLRAPSLTPSSVSRRGVSKSRRTSRRGSRRLRSWD